MTIVIISCSLLTTADNTEAAGLYKASRNKILEAKSLKIVVDTRYVFQTVVERKNNPKKKTFTQTATVKGTILMTTGNRVWAEVAFDRPGRGKTSLVMTCDGKKQRITSGAGKQETRVVKQAYAGSIREMIVRAGVTFMIFWKIDRNRTDKSRASDFKLAGREKVGDRMARILKFKLSDMGETYGVTLWIDTETDLPLKRVTSVDKKAGLRITETTTFSVNPKIDGKAFITSE